MFGVFCCQKNLPQSPQKCDNRVRTTIVLLHHLVFLGVQHFKQVLRTVESVCPLVPSAGSCPCLLGSDSAQPPRLVHLPARQQGLQWLRCVCFHTLTCGVFALVWYPLVPPPPPASHFSPTTHQRIVTNQPIVTNQLLTTNFHQPIVTNQLSSTNCRQPIVTSSIVINQLPSTNCHHPIVINR